ncbi:MAG: sialidase family protein [Candidatus Borkfalkiaceae bacterium]|nr:sialidase family protein [Christensenellaceae bacterium]
MDRIKLVQIDLLSCEAILRKAPNGDLIIVGQCGDVLEPAPENRIYIWRSKDNGETWSKRQLIYPEDGRAGYQTEVFVNENTVNVFKNEHPMPTQKWVVWSVTIGELKELGATLSDESVIGFRIQPHKDSSRDICFYSVKVVKA